MKLKEISRMVDDDKILIYIGRFKDDALNMLRAEAESKNMVECFYTMPILPDDYYLELGDFNKFNES